MRKQLFDSKKMEVVGSLTGIIAHDFNNMLLPIVGYSNLLIEALEDKPDLSKMASEINEAASGSTSLTNQLLAFSRRQMVDRELVDINELVEGTERMLRCLLGDRFPLILELEEECVRGRVNPGQIEQVLLNVCVNARDAMGTGGQITLTTESLGGEDHLPEQLRGSGDCWVRIAVSDRGRGMRREILERIFEPYFTTKDAEGAGLGMSIAQGIVSQHGGHIEVESLPGVGTNVSIYLRVEDVGAVEERPAPELEPVDDICGTEKILVIEDEPQVRAFVACALTNKGYDIDTAYDLASARKLLSEFQGVWRLRFDSQRLRSPGRDRCRLPRRAAAGVPGDEGDPHDRLHGSGTPPRGGLRVRHRISTEALPAAEAVRAGAPRAQRGRAQERLGYGLASCLASMT